ncbi:MAG: peptidylprolyl isomerase [Saprospiraceae bacterium]|nr:peptidylprolyl isomerase [Saprospiraceae bacterium]
MKRYFVLGILCTYLSASQLIGQDQVLFTVEDQEVPLSEFLYIYEKTNRDQADFSQASVMEYLDLYKKFKLNVKKARDMKLDTIQSLQQELAGYRKQLAGTYLNDKEVLNGLVEELYERMQKDVSFGHILLRLGQNASGEEAEAVYQKALSIREELRDGAEFEATALRFSEDESVRQNRGFVGYITAPMSDGFYELESTLYTIPTNTYSRPVRSKIGYHIVTVKNRRQARGEVEVRHILTRSGTGKNPKRKIDALHAQLTAGADFEDLARSESEDAKTAPSGGYLGAFGINKYESIFESTAFRLKEPGDISQPINTSIGWHIIQLIRKKPVRDLEEMRRSLETQVRRDSRFEIAESSMIDRIREENGYQKSDWDADDIVALIGEDFRTYKWKAPTNISERPLFKIGNKVVGIRDFTDYLATNTAERLRLNRIEDPATALENLYGKFEEAELLAFEEEQLDEKYPEFKALMREYSEGILLFEATKMKVWDKASQDTIGLKAFYKDHKQNYLWPERAEVETLTFNTTDEKVIAKIMAQLPKKSGAKLRKKFNKKRELIQSQKHTIEKEELDPDLKWIAGSTSEQTVDKSRDRILMKRVVKILDPEPKSLNEARGYIIADYQDFLEKKWIETLTEEYQVTINEDVLQSIIRS